MSRKTVDNVRKDKPFRLLDLAVYGALIVGILALFIAFVFRPHSGIGKIFIDVGSERIATYDFATDVLTATKGKERRVENMDGDASTVKIFKIYTDEEREGYNVVEFDTEKQSVRVTDANCSRHKDCVYSPAVTTADGIIICVPHGLKIYGEADNMDPSLG